MIILTTEANISMYLSQSHPHPQLQRLCNDFGLSISNTRSSGKKHIYLYDRHQDTALSPLFERLSNLEAYVDEHLISILMEYVDEQQSNGQIVMSA